MTNSETLHQDAMRLAARALTARQQADEASAQSLFQQALEKERAALALVGDVEPTRSVLHRSAATLALDCGDLDAAQALVTAGLKGAPPQTIAEELQMLEHAVRRARIERMAGELRTLVDDVDDIDSLLQGADVVTVRIVQAVREG